MIIKGKKYLFSKGLAFYAEMESQRLEKELSEGWLIDRIHWLGFYRLQQVEKEQAQLVIDFYPGKKSETDEYLDIYEAANWKLVTSYRNRYFIFKSDTGTEAVYTDEESYASRLSKERQWIFLNSLYSVLIGLLGLLLMKLPQTKAFLLSIPSIYYAIGGATMVSLLFPIVALSLLLYYKLIYSKRQTYYKEPKKYAKRQHFFIDILFAGLIGGVIGGIIGFVTGYLGLF